MMRKQSVALFLLWAFAWSPAAAIETWSTFDSGLEGWTLAGNGSLSHDPEGGNPGGYARFGDAWGPHGDGWLVAPAEFLGDWSALDAVGMLFWDHRVINGGEGPTYLRAQAAFSGPGGSAIFTSSDLLGHGWRSFSAPIAESAWNVSGDWNALLNNVTELRIRIEGVHNVGPRLDIDGIDNVLLTSYGDLNADGCVDHADLGILLGDWDCTGQDCVGDIDGDGATDHADLGILLAHWGDGCP